MMISRSGLVSLNEPDGAKWVAILAQTDRRKKAGWVEKVRSFVKLGYQRKGLDLTTARRLTGSLPYPNS